MQPMVADANGTVRFAANVIVQFLLNERPFDLETLAKGNFSGEAWTQFTQLNGYPVGDWTDLLCVHPTVARAASAKAVKLASAGSSGRSNSDSRPMQPMIIDRNGAARFRVNAIVRFLLDNGPFDLNALGTMTFSDTDRAQFAQLIGYSVTGWGDLSYLSQAAAGMADASAAKLVAESASPTAR